MIIKKLIREQSGQGIIELVIAIAVILVGIIGTVILAVFTLMVSQESKDLIIQSCQIPILP